MDDVTSRELLCRPLAALKNNRAEAEQREGQLRNGLLENDAPAAGYQPGLYAMIDWVASRMHKAGAAVWALVFDFEEIECFSVISELECVSALSACLV